MNLGIISFKIKSPLVLFVVRALALYILWLIVYSAWGSGAGGFDDKMTEAVGNISLRIMHALSYEVHSEWKPSLHPEFAARGAMGYYLSIGGKSAVMIGNPCNGLFMFTTFMCFIIAFPGDMRSKLWYVPAGVILLFTSNILRIIALIFNWMYSPGSLQFNHVYTYSFILYGLTFILWMFWINHYSVLRKTQEIQ